MRSRISLAVFLMFSAIPLFAQSNEVTIWSSAARLRAADMTNVDPKFANGNGVSYNRFWLSSLSTDFGYSNLHIEGHLRNHGEGVVAIGNGSTKLMTGIAQWHFGRGRLIDPYAGAGVAYVRSRNINGRNGAPSSDQVTAAGNAGVNFNVIKHAALALDAKYVPYETRFTTNSTSVRLKRSPIIFSVGVRGRF